MKLFVVVFVMLLAGCQTIVERKFPDIPPSIKTQCAPLQLVPVNTTKMSELLVVVTDNYNLYLECQAKVNAWQLWYKEQKTIFESVD
jgi:hypothetical protein